MVALRIDDQTIVAEWGSVANLDKAIADFKAELEAFKHTTFQPAPRAHPMIERLVYSAEGLYEIVVNPVNEPLPATVKVPYQPPPPPVPTLAELKEQAQGELRNRRWLRQEYGVTWDSNRYSGDLYTITDLLAGLQATDDVPTLTRTADGLYVELQKLQMQQILDAMTLMIRQTYNNEKRLSDWINSALDETELRAIDLGSGW